MIYKLNGSLDEGARKHITNQITFIKKEYLYHILFLETNKQIALKCFQWKR